MEMAMDTRQQFAKKIERQYQVLGEIEAAISHAVHMRETNFPFQRSSNTMVSGMAWRFRTMVDTDINALCKFHTRIASHLLPEQSADVLDMLSRADCFAARRRSRFALSGVSYRLPSFACVWSTVPSYIQNLEVRCSYANETRFKSYCVKPETNMVKWLAHRDQAVRELALRYMDKNNPLYVIDHKSVLRRIATMRRTWYAKMRDIEKAHTTDQ